MRLYIYMYIIPATESPAKLSSNVPAPFIIFFFRGVRIMLLIFIIFRFIVRP